MIVAMHRVKFSVNELFFKNLEDFISFILKNNDEMFCIYRMRICIINRKRRHERYILSGMNSFTPYPSIVVLKVVHKIKKITDSIDKQRK